MNKTDVLKAVFLERLFYTMNEIIFNGDKLTVDQCRKLDYNLSTIEGLLKMNCNAHYSELRFKHQMTLNAMSFYNPDFKLEPEKK